MNGGFLESSEIT